MRKQLDKGAGYDRVQIAKEMSTKLKQRMKIIEADLKLETQNVF